MTELRRTLLLLTATITLVCACVFGITCYLNWKCSKLQTSGVTTLGIVESLNTVTSGQNNHISNYRVSVRVTRGDESIQLSDDVSEAEWDSLSVGDSVSIVYAADDTRICLLGDQSDVDALLGRAQWWSWAGLAGLLASLPLTAVCAWGAEGCKLPIRPNQNCA